MSRRALRIKVGNKDKQALEKMLSGGVQQVRTVLRALALRQLGSGLSAPRIAESLPLTPQAIRKVATGMWTEGWNALYSRNNGPALPPC